MLYVVEISTTHNIMYVLSLVEVADWWVGEASISDGVVSKGSSAKLPLIYFQSDGVNSPFSGGPDDLQISTKKKKKKYDSVELERKRLTSLTAPGGSDTGLKLNTEAVEEITKYTLKFSRLKIAQVRVWP